MSRIDQDVFAGLFFIALGMLGLYLGWDYAFGTTQRMGAGFLPKVLCWCMIAVGALVVLFGALRNMPSPMEAWAWGPLLAILCGVLAFTALLEQQGLLLAIVALVLLASVAMPAPVGFERLLLWIANGAFLTWLTLGNGTLRNMLRKASSAWLWLFEPKSQLVAGLVAVGLAAVVVLVRAVRSTPRHVAETLAIAVLFGGLSTLVFIQGLGLVIRIWPEWSPWG